MPLDSTNWSQTETETKPDVFSLEGLIAWLETQAPEKSYVWFSSPECDGGCLLHQYLSAHHKDPLDDYSRIAEACGGRQLDIKVAMATPNTYGAALSRARALLASRNGDAYLAETRK